MSMIKRPDKDQFYNKTFQPVPPGIKKSTQAKADANTGKGKLPFDGKAGPPANKLHADDTEALRKRHDADGYDGYHAGYNRSNRDGYED
jgi:hypothetical protein